MITLVLAALAAAAVWGVSLYFWPWKPCPKCTRHAAARGGSGRSSGSNRGRFGACARCGGTGKTRRAGARTVHRAIESLADYHRKDRP